MAKRRATTQLSKDNWDQEDEKEDPGTFKMVDNDELKNRVIKKAKRSLNQKETSGISPFAAFSGFTKTSSIVNPFNFLKPDVQEADASSVNSTKMEVIKESNHASAMNEEAKTNELKVSDTKETTESSASEKRKALRSIEYYRQLQSLNKSVMNWMQLHLSKNACSDFTPVFNDYKKHLDTLNVMYPVKTNDLSNEKSNSLPGSTDKDSLPKNTSNNNNVSHSFSFKSSLKHDDETDYGAHFKSNTTNTSTCSYGNSKTPTATSSMSSGPISSLREECAPENKPFQFSSESDAKEESVSEKKQFQFSFGLSSNKLGNSSDSNFSKPFSFAATSVEKNANSESAGTEEPEYVPPKNDFTAVKEEDAFYSKRCKLFFKKDNVFVEKGIGTLHLKQLDEKTQLIIRADTSLGNILLNIILNESLPVSRTGKNNVLLVCVPNPPMDPKKADAKEAIPMLIRVKTGDDADELLEQLNKHKS